MRQLKVSLNQNKSFANLCFVVNESLQIVDLEITENGIQRKEILKQLENTEKSARRRKILEAQQILEDNEYSSQTTSKISNKTEHPFLGHDREP